MASALPFDAINWSDEPGIEQVVATRTASDGNVVEIPIAAITGSETGPTFAVMSGMHAGEYSGILAAQRLIQSIKPSELKGRLIVIPVISTLAFYQRNMQLCPVDQKELHFQRPGNPEGTFSECLIDTLFELLRDASYVIDSHAGEMAQALHPWVPVPMYGSKLVQEMSYNLAIGFNVPYIEPRYEPESIPELCRVFADAGIANIWVECGKQGVPTEHDMRTHYDGYIAALRTVGMLEGAPQRPAQKVLQGRRKQVNSNKTGVWHSAVQEGDIVEPGQLLGRLTDLFGNVLEEFYADARALVVYYWSSPAINADRTPHDYQWHNGLVSLIELDGDPVPAP